MYEIKKAKRGREREKERDRKRERESAMEERDMSKRVMVMKRGRDYDRVEERQCGYQKG